MADLIFLCDTVIYRYLQLELNICFVRENNNATSLLTQLLAKTWKHRHPSQYYANRQTRTLYFSKQREKMSFLLKGERMSSQKKWMCSAGRKAGERKDEKNEEMNRLYWHKGVIWGEIPSENYRMFVVKRTISKENSAKDSAAFHLLSVNLLQNGIFNADYMDDM